ncbi:FAD-dependent monooxygenase [Hyphomicrobiales bacterium 4NK60-0047b]
MSENQIENLIIGAGPVGLAAALELNRRGIPFKIIDNDGEPTPESRALAINARTLQIFESSGVSERLIKAGNKISGIIVRDQKTTLLKVDISKSRNKYNYLLALPQSQTENILIEALKEQNQNIEWYTSLKSITNLNNLFECSLTTNSEHKTIWTKNLIGADGAHSTVRKSLGFSFDGESVSDIWSLADVEISEWPYPFNNAVVTLTKDGPIAFFPFGEGKGRLVSSKPNLLNNLPKGMKVTKVPWQSEFKISYRQVATYQKGNAYLAGDAAHIHSPAGGRGMNMGIEDAATLAYLIENNQTERYTDLRHPVGKKILNFTKQQTEQITSPGRGLTIAIKYLAPVAFSIPFFRNRALKTLTGLDTPKPEWL